VLVFPTEGQAFCSGDSGRVFPEKQVRETIYDFLCPDDQLCPKKSVSRIDAKEEDFGERKEPQKFG
jgi:hypothetical protein